MTDRDQERPDQEASGAATFEEIAATFGILPKVVGAGDLDRLNSVLAEMFEVLRQAAVLRRAGEDRAAAIRALRAAWTFIARFEAGLGQNLHAPLMSLASALLALDQNNVEPLLKPTPAPLGGRAPDSPERQAMIGFAVGAVDRLRWTGMKRSDAHKAVADTFHKLGIGPGRGSGRITARTIREWCERVAADVGGCSTAAMNARLMLRPNDEARIKGMPPSEARKFVLDALALYVLT